MNDERLAKSAKCEVETETETALRNGRKLHIRVFMVYCPSSIQPSIEQKSNEQLRKDRDARPTSNSMLRSMRSYHARNPPRATASGACFISSVTSHRPTDRANGRSAACAHAQQNTQPTQCYQPHSAPTQPCTPSRTQPCTQPGLHMAARTRPCAITHTQACTQPGLHLAARTRPCAITHATASAGATHNP